MSKEYVCEKKKIGKYTVKVLQDIDPINPRKEWDNQTTMVCFHRSYDLGDKHYYSSSKDEDLISLLKRKDVYYLPLYLYDHSGITMNTTGFSCRWDSGQVGYIYMERATYLKNWNKKRMNKKHIYEILRAEVEDYDNYLTGQVYGYVVSDDTNDYISSCWSFFGDTKYALEEGIRDAQYLIRKDIKEHVEQVKLWIKNRVPLEKRIPLTV